MKKRFFLLPLILFFLACKEEKQSDNTNKNFSSKVIVEILNAEEEKLVLSIQGEDFENREIQTIKNGKAIFDVTYNNSDVALIEYFHNLENIKVMRTWIPVLLDNDTIVVNTEMVRDSIEFDEPAYKAFYKFKNWDFKENSKNIKYKKSQKKLYNLTKGITYSHSILDSLNQTVFPKIRTNSIDLFDNEFSNLNDRIQLELFDDMLNLFAFRPEYLNAENRKSINKIYYNISNIDKSANYRLKTIDYQISNINNYGKENQLTFKDFDLIDIKENKVNLKDIAEQNEFTVLYFWFSSCGPCRSFNQKIDNETIKDLNENEIEFVSINTDFNKEDWKKSSKQDNVFWKNLYGGNLKDDIEYEYGIRGYPTKVVFNKNLELIEFSFSNPKDLLELKELQLEKQIK